MNTFKLANGNEIPEIAFGTWSLNGQDAADAVCSALKAGYRHIDTAMFYGNEEFVGEGIRRSGVPREEIFLTSKIWQTDFDAEKVRPAYAQSLKNLGVDYLDLFLLHWPYEDYVGAWKILGEMYEEGLIRNIGVSNFQIHHLKEVERETGIRPLVDQIESNPRFQQRELADYCHEQGIVVEAWGPLGKGKLLDDPVLTQIAGAYGKTTAQIMIRWNLQHDVIPLPKTVHEERMKSNLEVFDFVLTGEDMARIDALETGRSERSYAPEYRWK